MQPSSARAPTLDPSRRAIMQAGFTLLELLVVLVIVGFLAGLVGPRLLEQLDRSRITTAETQARLLKTALDTLRIDLGRYPSAEEGLGLLLAAPSSGTGRERWRGPYLEGAIPVDPWGNRYQYSPRGRLAGSPAVYSFGPRGPGASAEEFIGLLPAR